MTTCTMGIARQYNETRAASNESGCCFYHGYHNCVVAFCEECEDSVVWDHLNRWWNVIGTDEPHHHAMGPPEHFAVDDQGNPLSLDGQKGKGEGQ